MNAVLGDRRILVTGAAQGLGLSIARRLAAGGARTVLVDVQSEVIERAREDVFGNNVLAMVKDLSDPASAEDVIRAAVARFGSLDGLVNCAAWSLHKPAAQITVEEFDRLVAINQRAPFFLSRHFSAQLAGSDRDPCIVNIGSINAVIGNPNLSAYAGTKAALIGMTRALAVEFAPRIRVVAISPGSILTPATEQRLRNGRIEPTSLLDGFPIRRFIGCEEVAEVVALLFGPAALSATGVNWILDGGYTAR